MRWSVVATKSRKSRRWRETCMSSLIVLKGHVTVMLARYKISFKLKVALKTTMQRNAKLLKWAVILEDLGSVDQFFKLRRVEKRLWYHWVTMTESYLFFINKQLNQIMWIVFRFCSDLCNHFSLFFVVDINRWRTWLYISRQLSDKWYRILIHIVI